MDEQLGVVMTRMVDSFSAKGDELMMAAAPALADADMPLAAAALTNAAAR